MPVKVVWCSLEEEVWVEAVEDTDDLVGPTVVGAEVAEVAEPDEADELADGGTGTRVGAVVGTLVTVGTPVVVERPVGRVIVPDRVG